MLGFIGTGAITEAVVTGLCGAPEPPSILLSPRSADRAEALAARFPGVTVARDNQGVIDGSEIVVLAVRPQDAAQALAGLRFRPEQTVVSFMALTPMAKLRALVEPVTRICRVCPLPGAAERIGPIAIWPALPEATALLGRVGTLVALPDEAQLEPVWATTCLMAPFYEQLQAVAGWLADKGVPDELGAAYVANLYLSWSHTAAGNGDFAALRDGSQTKGGLNEQALRTLTSEGHYRQLQAILDVILKRLEASAK